MLYNNKEYVFYWVLTGRSLLRCPDGPVRQERTDSLDKRICFNCIAYYFLAIKGEYL